MAEFVQYRSENTIGELEQMQRIELFTNEEIRLIAAKRKRHEYKMQRMTKSKDIFLRYIQYELDLIRLIAERRQGTNITFKFAEIELPITRRINRLFIQACRRYKADIKLWMTHIKFCNTWNMKDTIGTILTNMLAVHSDKVRVWKFAAKWQEEHNDSFDTARALILRGIRFHPKSKSLYKAFVALELKCATQKKQIQCEKSNLEADLLSAEIDILEKKLDKVGAIAKKKFKKMIEDNRAIIAKKKDEHHLKTNLVEIVIDSTLVIFHDVQTFIEIFDVIKSFKDTTPLLLSYMKKLQEKFPCNEHIYELKARGALKDGYLAGKCKSAYAVALKSLPTELMWCFYLEALLSSGKCPRKTRRKEFVGEFTTCHNLKLLKEKFYPKLIEFCDEDRKLPTLREGLDRFPKSGELHYMHVCMLLAKGSEEDAVGAFEKAEAALGKDNLDMLILYKAMIQHYETKNLALADKLFKRSLYVGPNVSTELKPRFLHWVADLKGIEEARVEYQKLKLSPPLSLALHYKMIELEMDQQEVNKHNVRMCYDLATHQFGEKDIDIWMKFIEFETKSGDPKLVSSVFSRAKAQLSADLLEKFVTQHTIKRSEGA